MATTLTTTTAETEIKQPIGRIWELFTRPEHIVHWYFATDEWHCPNARNDLRKGGRFNWRMESKDGTMGFDFTGIYTQVERHKLIDYRLDDGRQVSIVFTNLRTFTHIRETFEVEDINTIEQQRTGWQLILNNFKKYAETLD